MFCWEKWMEGASSQEFHCIEIAMATWWEVSTIQHQHHLSDWCQIQNVFRNRYVQKYVCQMAERKRRRKLAQSSWERLRWHREKWHRQWHRTLWSHFRSTDAFVIVFVTCRDVSYSGRIVSGCGPNFTIPGYSPHLHFFVMENKISWRGLILYVGINIKYGF